MSSAMILGLGMKRRGLFGDENVSTSATTSTTTTTSAFTPTKQGLFGNRSLPMGTHSGSIVAFGMSRQDVCAASPSRMHAAATAAITKRIRPLESLSSEVKRQREEDVEVQDTLAHGRFVPEQCVTDFTTQFARETFDPTAGETTSESKSITTGSVGHTSSNSTIATSTATSATNPQHGYTHESRSSAKPRKFTSEEVQRLIAEAVSVRENQLRDEFARELNRLLNEQFESFSRYCEDQRNVQLRSSKVSYIS